MSFQDMLAHANSIQGLPRSRASRNSLIKNTHTTFLLYGIDIKQTKKQLLVRALLLNKRLDSLFIF